MRLGYRAQRTGLYYTIQSWHPESFSSPQRYKSQPQIHKSPCSLPFFFSPPAPCSLSTDAAPTTSALRRRFAPPDPSRPCSSARCLLLGAVASTTSAQSPAAAPSVSSSEPSAAASYSQDRLLL